MNFNKLNFLFCSERWIKWRPAANFGRQSKAACTFCCRRTPCTKLHYSPFQIEDDEWRHHSVKLIFNYLLMLKSPHYYYFLLFTGLFGVWIVRRNCQWTWLSSCWNLSPQMKSVLCWTNEAVIWIRFRELIASYMTFQSIRFLKL